MKEVIPMRSELVVNSLSLQSPFVPAAYVACRKSMDFRT
jgi:hypothetical protein